jgi:hypothetical protein
MAKHLTPEEDREADRLYAEFQLASKKMHEAKKQYGPDSPECIAAVKIEGDIWEKYCKLRTPPPEMFGLPKELWK